MNKPLLFALVLVLASAGAYRLGQLDPAAAETAAAQGRGPTVPAPRAPKKPRAEAPLVFGQDGGSSSSANGFLAVTGSYGVGTSVLYLIDTNTRQISVYEARGGTQSMRRLVWVGARRIDRDLEVLGYRDESEYSFSDLEKLFNRRKKVMSEDGRLLVPDTPGAAGASVVPRRPGRRRDRGK